MPRSSITRNGGIKRYLTELRIDDDLVKSINEAANVVRNAARRLIRSGGKSGREYTRTTKGGARKQYTASAPGQPPASFSGTLASRIRVKKAKPGGLAKKAAFVVAAAPHSHLLEFGTSARPGGGTMEARPFMAPAMNQARAQNFQRIKRGARATVRKAAQRARKGKSA